MNSLLFFFCQIVYFFVSIYLFFEVLRIRKCIDRFVGSLKN